MCDLTIRGGFILLLSMTAIGNPLRCTENFIAPATCSRIRNVAMETGCISTKEFAALEEAGRIPVCFEGKKAGDCPCDCFHCFGPNMRLQVVATGSTKTGEIRASDLFSRRDWFELSWSPLAVLDRRENYINAPRYWHTEIREMFRATDSHSFVRIELSDGRVLSLAETFPIVTMGGIRLARDLTKEHRLLNAHDLTKLAYIRDIRREKFNGTAYGIAVGGGTSRGAKAFILEGILVGAP